MTGGDGRPVDDSRPEIEHLVADYCYFIDRRERLGFLGLWTADAHYDFPDGHGAFDGATGVAAAYEAITTTWRRTFHWTTNLRIDFADADGAQGRADALVLLERPDRSVSLLAATYEDSYRRTPTGWRVSARKVTRWFLTRGVDLPLTRPGPPTADG